MNKITLTLTYCLLLSFNGNTNTPSMKDADILNQYANSINRLDFANNLLKKDSTSFFFNFLYENAYYEKFFVLRKETNRLLESDTNNSYSLLYSALLWWKMDEKRAKQFIERSIKADPKNFYAKQFYCYYIYDFEYENTELFESSHEALVRDFPQTILAYETVVNNYYNNHLNSEDFPKKANKINHLCTEAINKFDSPAEVITLLANLLNSQNQTDSALILLEKNLALNHPKIFSLYGYLLMSPEQKNDIASKYYLEKAFELDPLDRNTIKLLAEVNWFLRDLDEAWKYYKVLIQFMDTYGYSDDATADFFDFLLQEYGVDTFDSVCEEYNLQMKAMKAYTAYLIIVLIQFQENLESGSELYFDIANDYPDWADWIIERMKKYNITIEPE